MVSLGKVKLAGVIMTIGLIAISTNLAFAQQPSCGEQPYVYNIGCMPLGTAQLTGAALMAGIIAFAIAWGVAGRQHHIVPNFN